MNVNEAIEVINTAIGEALEQDADAMSWDAENEIKQTMISNCELDEVFTDESEIENMYMADFFDESHGLSTEKHIEMIESWLNSIEELTDIEVELDTSEIE